MLRSIGLSLQVAAIVTVFDIMVGVPIAWILARYEFRGKNVLDTLVDMPMAVPTSALGFSIYLFWGTNNGISRLYNSQVGFVSQGTLLIILAHVAFTFPYVTRSIRGIISDLDLNNPSRVANNKTSDLGQDSPQIVTIDDKPIETVDQEDIITALSSSLDKDPDHSNFTITLGIDIYCEDNGPPVLDHDTFEALIIKSFNLTFTYERKIEK